MAQDVSKRLVIKCGITVPYTDPMAKPYTDPTARP